MSTVMQVAGVEGSVTLDGYQGWVPLNSAELSIKRSLGGGSSAGRGTLAPSVSELQVTRVLDSASGALYELCLTGKPVAVTIAMVYMVGQKPELIAKYELEDVVFTGYTLSSHQPEDDPQPMRTESLALNFLKITWHIVETDKTNKPTRTRRTMWDLTQARGT